MDCICKIINHSFLGMSIGGWVLSFFISCLASYAILYLTILKDRETYRKNRIEKLNDIKERMFRVRDWTDSIEKNIDNNESNVLDTKESVLPKESLIIALQLEELRDEYSKIISMLDSIAIIENNCKSKRYLKNNFEKEQLMRSLSYLKELANEMTKTKVESKRRDLGK